MYASVPRFATIIIVGIVVLAGAVVTIIHPETLPFRQYVHDVSIGGGLLGVGLGIDSGSRP